MTAIGIDIGGTHSRVGLVDRLGKLLAHQRNPTPKEGNVDDFIEGLGQAVEAISRDTGAEPGTLVGIGLAVPGLLDPERGTIVRAVNLPWLEGQPLRARLADRTNLPVTLLSDADAATWGEYWAGQRQVPEGQRQEAKDEEDNRQSAIGNWKSESFVHLRLGTGIACGWAKDGALQVLEPGRTGHLEWLVVDRSDSAIPCRCGKRGCLDTIASGHILTECAKKLGLPNGLASLEQAFQKNNPAAAAIINQAAHGIAAAIRHLFDQTNAEVLCLGGGVFTHLPSLFTQALRQTARGQIVPATLADDAGLLGAAMMLR